jgi:N-formylglutamate deformylase
MFLSEKTVPPYVYRRGSSPLIVSMPHAGTFIPHSIGGELDVCAALRPDTDWHLERLYDFVRELDATVIMATHSRYVVDVNRPPDGANLYPGQDTPRLCPIDTFERTPLYRRVEPGAQEIAQRLQRVWHPYHRRIAREIARLEREHANVVLWDAHSIASQVPRLFPGRLADFNLGTADGASCDARLGEALHVALRRHASFTSVRDGRFKGGYITRHYGAPRAGVQAVQMEMATCTYMEEQPPYPWREERAVAARAVLRDLLETALDWASTASHAAR